jgi:parallel beta-helix repeat protein
MHGPVRLIMSTLASFGVLGGLLGPALPAHAAEQGALACGQTITVDTTLTADLTGCVGPGLVIGADGITLDLAGHTLAGDGRADACPGNLFCDVGVDDGAGYSDVTVTGGGTVRGFVVGVQAAAPANNLRLERLTIRDNSRFGALVHGGDDAVYARDVFADNGISGLVAVDAHRVQVTRNTVTGGAGYGTVLFHVDTSTVSNTIFRANDQGVLVTGSDNTIVDNTVTNSSGSSIDVVDGASRNRVVRNRLSDNGDGIVLAGAIDTYVSGNVVTGTGQFGGPNTGGFGLILDGSATTTIVGNTITGGRGPAVLVTSLDNPNPSVGNVVSSNRVSSRDADALVVEHGAVGTVVDRNRAFDSGGDGIRIDAAGTVVTSNIADNNHALGIQAGAGTVDGGGNRARGNGDPAQCTGVICR